MEIHVESGCDCHYITGYPSESETQLLMERFDASYYLSDGKETSEVLNLTWTLSFRCRVDSGAVMGPILRHLGTPQSGYSALPLSVSIPFFWSRVRIFQSVAKNLLYGFPLSSMISKSSISEFSKENCIGLCNSPIIITIVFLMSRNV